MIKDNKIIGKIYKSVFYFELGKGQIARLYGWIPEIIIIIGGVKYLLGVNMSKTFIVTFFFIIIILFVVTGLIFHKSGLWSVDRYVQVSKDPVQSEILSAARKINET